MTAVLTNKIDDSICKAEGACSLNATSNKPEVRAQFRLRAISVGLFLSIVLFGLKVSIVFLGQVGKASDNVLANQVLGFRHVTLLRDLNLKLTTTKAKVQDLFHTP